VARHQLRLTPSADAAIRELRGKPAEELGSTEAQKLKAQGCRAARYRLLGDCGWSSYCCGQLHGQWRVISTFESDIVWVITVSEHDGPQFYKRLSEDLDISGVGRTREQKPSCCGEDGWPTIGTREAFST